MTPVSSPTNTSFDTSAAYNTSIFTGVGSKDWYLAQARRIVGQYNTRYTAYGAQYDNSALTPLERMAKNYSYYQGTQKNNDYYYTNVDENNKPLNTVWIPGQTIKKLVNFMYGMGEIMINNIRISTRAISKDAVNRKTKTIDAVRLKFSMPEEFGQLAEAGIQFNPIGDADKEFGGMDDVENWGKTYQDVAERFASMLSKDAYFRNRLDEKSRIALLHTFITGICAFHTYAHKGKVITDLVHPMQLIWDRSDQFDPYNRQGRYAGLYTYLTPTQILARWQNQLNDDEIKELKSLTMDNVSTVLRDSLLPNFNWYQRQAGGSDVQLAVTTIYFKGPRDLREKKAEKPNKYGKQPIMSLNDTTQNGDYITECTYKMTWIGGRYLVDWGIAENQTRNWTYNPSESELPIKMYAPQVVMGELSSVVSQLFQHQDRADFLVNELTKRINLNLGKVHIINGAMLGNKSSVQLLNDFRRMGISVANLSDGEELDYEDKRPMVNTIDMSTNGDIQTLIELRAYEEKVMESIVNVSEIAMGQQQQYVSSTTQQQSIGQNNLGTAYIFNGFIRFMKIVMNHATNVAKIIHTMEDGDEIPVVGEKGTEWLKETKAFKFEDFDVEVEVMDMISPEAKARILNGVQGLAQNMAVSALDIIKIEKATSYRELELYFEMTLKKQAKEAERQQAIQAQQQLAQQEQANQGQMQLEQARQAGANERTEATIQGKLAETAFSKAAEGDAEMPME